MFGAFRGAAWPFAALCRLLFIAADATVELDHFPTRLLTATPLRDQCVRVEGPVGELVAAYLAGDSADLVEAFTEVCSHVAMRTPFEQNLMLADLVTLEEFFDRGPSRVKRLRAHLKLDATWVEPEALVDYLAAEGMEAAVADFSVAAQAAGG